MKKINLLCIGLLGSLLLAGCSNKTNTVYDETLSEKEVQSLDSVVSELAEGLNIRYTLNDSDVDKAANLFTDPSSFRSSYSNYKQRMQEANLDAVNLYLDSYIEGEKAAYEEAKDFGLKHGLLYTNGKATEFMGSIEEIEPLIEGQTLEDMSSVENAQVGLQETTVEETLAESTEEETESLAESANETESLEDSDSTEETENTESTERLDSSDVKILSKDEYTEEYREEEIAERLVDVPDTKEGLLEYINTMEVPYDMDEDSLGIIYEGISSLEHSAEGLSQEEIDAMSYEELYEWLYNFEECRYDLLLEENEFFKDLDENYNKYLEEEQKRIQEMLASESSVTHEATPYEIWCIDNKDIIEMIEGTNFEEPAFSEVIEHDENGYYIPWEKIYALADDEGRLTEYLEFIAYGQTVNIKMPEAPLSYYADKKVRVVDWSVIVKEAGGEYLSLTLSLPDKLNYVTLELGLAEDNKLYYNSDIATYVFD